ncbi:MAG TPA: DUF4239 domain-containing protein [Pseudolabrys sp.]|nr:DUF4239 domain-containing protein [Pseudolabrys sp.]
MPSLTTDAFFLTDLSLRDAAVILLIPTTVFAMIGPLVVRRFVPIKSLRANNEVAGFKFATVGVIFAVLLAFVIVMAWERFEQADHDVANEASAAATVYRLTKILDPVHAAEVRKATTNYLRLTIAKDWSAMREGTSSSEVTDALTGIYNSVLKDHQFSAYEGLVITDLLRNIDRISEMRRQRLVAAKATVPGVIWMVLFAGAFLTISFTFFFGTDSLRAQVVMSGALSILIFLGLLTIAAIDRPFAGAVMVTPDALINIVNDFGDVTPPDNAR